MPFVRVVVLAYDGAEMTMECLQSIDASKWPRERLEIVLVDNGSLDDVVERVRRQLPHVRVLEPLKNLGFAGGCNLGITATHCSQGRKLTEFDYVALVNNDATVSENWLEPLAAALDLDPRLGAAAPKILFADMFHEVEISRLFPDSANGITEPVCLSGVRVNGARVDERVSFDEGFGGPSPFDPDAYEEFARWTTHGGRVRIKSSGESPVESMKVSLRLGARVPGTVLLRTELGSYEMRVGEPGKGSREDSMWVECDVSGKSFDLLNNVGSEIYLGGSSGDRGFLERDRGQYDEPIEVSAWCGGAVLLRKKYLDEVGLFDEAFFLYYEDTDLAWRGRLAGWRYAYVPDSLVRHRHAQSSVAGSELFLFQVERNRVLVLIKNAPLSLAAKAFAGELRRFSRTLFGGVVIPAMRLSLPKLSSFRFRWKVLRSLLSLSPHALRSRWSVRPKVSRRRVFALAVEKVVPFPAFEPPAARKISNLDSNATFTSRPTVAIYNLFWDTMGGGEMVSGEIARALGAGYDVTLLGPVHPGDSFLERLGIDILGFTWRTVSADDEASQASAEYDVFINCTYSSRALNRAPIGLYYVHFPRVLTSKRTEIALRSGLRLVRLARRLPVSISKFATAERLFEERLGDDSWVTSYTTFIANSRYTQKWIRKIWKVDSDIVFPPVTGRESAATKAHVIASIGRFFDPSLGHSKKQMEMLTAFADMARSHEGVGDWRLALVGGADAPSRNFVMRIRRAAQDLPIDVHVNAPRDIVDETLTSASIYWHAGGYGEDEHRHPERFEHFGISIVEAMAAGAVPLVFGVAGPAEIVRHGIDGFHWHTLEQLAQQTRRLIGDPDLLRTMSQSAQQRAQDFDVEVFTEGMRTLVDSRRSSQTM